MFFDLFWGFWGVGGVPGGVFGGFGGVLTTKRCHLGIRDAFFRTFQELVASGRSQLVYAGLSPCPHTTTTEKFGRTLTPGRVFRPKKLKQTTKRQLSFAWRHLGHEYSIPPYFYSFLLVSFVPRFLIIPRISCLSKAHCGNLLSSKKSPAGDSLKLG